VKRMKWLLSVLVVLAGLYGLLQFGSARKARPRPLFPAFRTELAAKITLHTSDANTVLEKKGDVWVVTSEDSFPAEADAVKQILDAGKGFSRRDMISANPQKQALYQVDSSGVAVTVEDTRGKVLASFVVGKLGADYQSTYIRDMTSNDVILAQGYFGPTFDRGKRSWQDKLIFRVEPNDVVEVGVTRPGLAMVLKRSAEGKWFISQPESIECEAGKASRLVKTLANLRCENFAWHVAASEAGVDNPDSSAWFKTADGTERKVLIGHGAGEGRFYVKRGDISLIYIVPAQTVKVIMPDVADLLPRPAEAAKAQP